MSGAALRPDLAAIADMIPARARVLDIGCGDGVPLEHLVRTKDVDERGIELSQQNVNACVALARGSGAAIEKAHALSEAGHTRPMEPDAWGPNIFADGAIFLLRPR